VTVNEFKRQGRLHLAIYGSRPKRMIIQIVCYDVMTDVSDKMKEWLEMFCDGATKQQLEVLKANFKKTFELQVFPGHPRKRPAATPAAAAASGGDGGAKKACVGKKGAAARGGGEGNDEEEDSDAADDDAAAGGH
jgi:hypothetical protein